MYLAKLFGADGVRIGLGVLSDEDLLYQIKVCANVGMTPVLAAGSLRQLRRATALLANHTAVVTLDDRDVGTMRLSEGPRHRAAGWLGDQEVRANLAAAKAPPVLLVEGKEVEGDARRELVELGVKGMLRSCAGVGAPGVAAEAQEKVPANAV